MKKVYNFIQETCQDYLKFQKQKDNPVDQMKLQLIKNLRKYLLEINVPFASHKNIEKFIFEKKVYNLLDEALSNTQKKLLFSWVRNNMIEYYKLQFNSVTLRDKTFDKIVGAIINLGENLDYKSIVRAVNNFLDEISSEVLF